ncbi:MAG: LLM class flavin-dependent oxidoreductase [Actinomycetota bacterium]|nr:LLM class flavin-dependent oxidoreductase [Actinomycetota bacterium]
MRLAAIVSCRHRLGADSARALADDRQLVAALQESADVLVLEYVCPHGEHWNLNGISYAAYLAEQAGPLGAVVRGLPLGVRNPVELAEALATLDHAWTGRFAAGLVLATPEQLSAYGKDPDLANDRFDESLVILSKMWSGRAFSADGAAYRFAEVRPTLLPYTAGGPPMSLSVADRSAAILAARRGLGLHLPGSAAGSAADLITSYRQADGAGEVSVEIVAGDTIGSTVAALDQLGVDQVDLRLPAVTPDPAAEKGVAELFAAAGWALGR